MSILIKGMEMPKNCHECIAGYGGLCFVAPAESDAICPDNGRADFCTLIPAADVVERKKGEWLCERLFDWETANIPGVMVYASPKCSICGETYLEQTNYCPYCGADMRGEE